MTVGLNGRAGEWAIGRDGETAIGRSADQRFERSSLSDFALWSLMAGFHYGQAFSGEAATQDSLGLRPRNRNLQVGSALKARNNRNDQCVGPAGLKRTFSA
jgi:hypothetical protein